VKTAAKIEADLKGGRDMYRLAMQASLFRVGLNKGRVTEAAPIVAHRPTMGILLATAQIVNPLRFLLILSFCPLLAAAQESPNRYFEAHRVAVDTPEANPASTGRITVHADPKVQRLMERYVAVKHPVAGFRVQIFLGERKAAEEAKRSYLQKNPESPAYLSWFAPNWRVRVGDCRTRVDAERLLRDLKPIYSGSYIVPDEIEMVR